MGIRRRLDYLVSPGVDAIWISPVYPSPTVDFGYDVADYCVVDPRFGSLADFDDLHCQLTGRPDDWMMPGTASTICRSLYSLSPRASSAR